MPAAGIPWILQHGQRAHHHHSQRRPSAQAPDSVQKYKYKTHLVRNTVNWKYCFPVFASLSFVITIIVVHLITENVQCMLYARTQRTVADNNSKQLQDSIRASLHRLTAL